MKDFFKLFFVEVFTLMAWVTLLGYVIYCETVGIKTDSVRDAWNILLLISGFVWGRGAKENKKGTETGATTAEFTASVTTEPINDKENE